MTNTTMAADVWLWQTLSFRDADAMMRWLSAIGFVEHATYRDETDPAVVVHAEWLWPGGGGVMFGSERPNPDWPMTAGQAGTYLVTDDPDGAFARAIDAGATVVRQPREEEYGGRGAVVRDPEGNHWSFGSYQPR
jgi:uncharacterized glyoxalase superfamily protein PhnB